MTQEPVVPQAFDHVAEAYQQKALVQYKAAQRLLARVPLSGHEDILDIGCGPGHITDFLAAQTHGRVVGTDISPGMVAEARAQYPRLEFVPSDVLALPYEAAFDVVVCNSAFQWFRDPERAARVMHRALRPGGRLALACPASWETFEQVVREVAAHPEIQPVFAHWCDPWTRLPSAGAYQAVFEQAGFQTLDCDWVRERSALLIDQAYQVYLSGAGNGYAGAACYNLPLPEGYVSRFNRLVRTALEARLEGLKLEVTFERVYYVGQR